MRRNNEESAIQDKGEGDDDEENWTVSLLVLCCKIVKIRTVK